MLCHRCGTHVANDAISCHNCGASLAGQSSQGKKTGTITLRRKRRQQAPSDLPYRVGSTIAGRFEVKEVLGSGALGAVYKVIDKDLDMELALKVILPTFLSGDTTLELRKALRRVRKLSHTNIIRIYDEGLDGQNFYFTMQYLEGLTLRKIINLRKDKKQVFALSEVEPILSQIAEALEYAHTTLFHGYLKPQNIIVLPDVLKLTDLGIAPALAHDKLLRAQKDQGDSLYYLAPEVRGGQETDNRADIYSMGVLLGEMLTGKIYKEQFESINELNPDCEPLLDVVFKRAVDPDPMLRYQHVADLLADISNILDHGELAEDEDVPTVISDADRHALLDELHPPPSPFAAFEEEEELEPPPVTFDSAGELTPPPLPSAGGSTTPPPLPVAASSPQSEKLQEELDELLESHEPPPALSSSPPLPPGSGQNARPLNPPNLPGQGPTSPFHPPRAPVLQTPRRPNDFGGAPIAPPPQRMAVPQPNLPHPHEDDDGGFSALGIFLFFLGTLLLFGAGGIGIYLKFVYFPQQAAKRQAQRRILASRRRQSRPRPRERVGTPRNTPLVPRVGIEMNGPPAGRPQTNKRTTPPEKRPEQHPEQRPEKRPERRPPPARRIERRPPPKRRTKKVTPRVVRRPPPRRTSPCPSGMKYIMSGSFKMGSAANDEMRSFGEKANVRTFTRSYCIDRYEFPGRGRRPKVNVSWSQAKSACEKRGKRLCTEKEWERACKGYRNYRYPYGNKFNPNACNTRTKAGKNRSIASTGRFRSCRSSFRVYDLSGNVAEWTSSRFRAGKSWRIIRGGSSRRPDWDVRCASRSNKPPSTRKGTLGFRCCADPKK